LYIFPEDSGLENSGSYSAYGLLLMHDSKEVVSLEKNNLISEPWNTIILI
jgi:hypothetical protein